MRPWRRPDVLRDPEVLRLLADEPKLLAIADAIYATLGSDYRRRQRRLRAGRLGVLATVVVIAVILGLLQPWRAGGGGIVAEALAAVPARGPVVHSVLRTEVPGEHLVELSSGRDVPEIVELEFWFDERHERLHMVVRREGVVVGDLLLTPKGAISAAGRVITAASGSILNPALIGFVTGYRNALQSGAARPLGRTSLARQQVTMLAIKTRFGREQVALDPQTLKPLAIRALTSGGVAIGLTARVVELAAIPTREANFERPRRRSPGPTGGSVVSNRSLSPHAASRVLTPSPVWVGQRLGGLNLRVVQQQRLDRFYAATSPPTRRSFGVGLDLIYGAVRQGRPDWGQSFLEIAEAVRPEPAYGFLSGTLSLEPAPRIGAMRVERLEMLGATGGAIWRAQLRSHGLYLTLTASSRTLVIAAARALAPIPHSVK